MNGQISTWPIDAPADSCIQNSEPFPISQRTKASTRIVSYVQKLVMLTLQYSELSLPFTAALRAAEADLQDFGD
jgi:hypothetical protein